MSMSDVSYVLILLSVMFKMLWHLNTIFNMEYKKRKRKFALVNVQYSGLLSQYLCMLASPFFRVAQCKILLNAIKKFYWVIFF